MNPLTNNEKKQLRKIGHDLKPVVTVAENGLSENVLQELNRALEDHELIKAKLVIPDRKMRAEVAADICRQCNASNVQSIGQVVLLYRSSKKPSARLSNILRASSQR